MVKIEAIILFCDNPVKLEFLGRIFEHFREFLYGIFVRPGDKLIST